MNGMLPAAMRSNRAGSLFKQMCVESTGTASFTFFAPCGQASNLTAFHQETKKRRSWNCGCGDFIVQPLCTAASVRLPPLPLNCLKSQPHHDIQLHACRWYMMVERQAKHD